MLASSDIWKRLFPASSGGGGGRSGSAGKRGLLSSSFLFNRYNNNSSTSRRRSNSTIMDQLLLKLNPMRLCAGLKVLGYFMVVLVVAIIGITYYAVVVITWGPHLLDGGANSFFSFLTLILFHYLLVLLTWCYLMVVLRDPGSVPENWKLVSLGNIEEGSITADPGGSDPQNLTPTLASLDGVELGSAVRYCNTCRNGKPPRCHHCSICQRCVLKMDHHCIWVVNCVGAQNYKFFLLFVLYAFLETMLDTLVLLPSFINFFEQAKHHSLSPADLAVTFLAFVLNLAFALSLLCFVVMHVSLLLSNTTSVEVYEKKRTTRWKYDLGRKRNFEQVFGTKKLFWFFPLFSGDDLKNIPALHGLEFPICSDMGE